MTDAKSATFRVGLIQMRSGRTPRGNIDAAVKLIHEAKAAGADYVQTPEMTNIMEVKREAMFAALTPEESDPSLAAFRETARSQRLWVHVGSLALKVTPDKAVNRSFLIDPQGEVAISADLPWGRLGLTICYDLRFPALYRALAEAGASFLAIPSAFTRQTGEAHWHVLMRARAIENTSYVLAAAQGGKHENGRETFGHSLVVDPWGRIVAEGGSEPCVVMAEIAPADIVTARARIPSLQHGRRFEVVAPAAEPAYLHAVGRGS